MTKIFDVAKKDEKITDYIMKQVRNAILSGQLKPGNRLASEKELIEEFQVSKATLREALRGLETMGLIGIRKGAAGGIFITEVNSQTLMYTMMNFMHFQTTSIREITMLRYMLEPHIARIAATKIIDEEIEQLEAFVNIGNLNGETHRKQNTSFHHYMSRITKSSLLILIVDFIDHMLNEIKGTLDLQADFHKDVQSAHKEILRCLKNRDSDGAGRAMVKDVVMVGKYMSEKMGEESFDPSNFDFQDDSILQMISSNKNVKILKDTGSADMYLVVPHDSSQDGTNKS